MKKFLLFLGVALCATFMVNEASAQIKVGQEGQISIALESNNILYLQDKLAEEFNPDNARDKVLVLTTILRLTITLVSSRQVSSSMVTFLLLAVLTLQPTSSVTLSLQPSFRSMFSGRMATGVFALAIFTISSVMVLSSAHTRIVT